MKMRHCVGCFCISVVVIGCNQKSSPFAEMPSEQSRESAGRSLNPIRRELGLLLIGDNWVLYKSDASEEQWVIRKGSPSGKTVIKDPLGNVIKEEDHYYSGARFTSQHDYGWEFISAMYDYRTKQIALGYSGTNEAVAAAISPFSMTVNGGSTDVVGAMAAVRMVAASWPDGPK